VWNIKVTSIYVVLVYHIYSNGGSNNSNFVKYIAGIVDLFFTYTRYNFFFWGKIITCECSEKLAHNVHSLSK
jgi:hypothetical protein